MKFNSLSLFVLPRLTQCDTNETLISVDFDELLDEGRFASVEKIKTIGSTYMAVSGLNPIADVWMTDFFTIQHFFKQFLIEKNHFQKAQDEYCHLVALVDFALAMKDCLDDVNHHSFNSFQLRVGKVGSLSMGS